MNTLLHVFFCCTVCSKFHYLTIFAKCFFENTKELKTTDLSMQLLKIVPITNLILLVINFLFDASTNNERY